MKKALILFILLLNFVQFSFSQTETTDSLKSEQLFVVTKFDGTEYIGKILSDDGREVLIETEALGKIYIPKSEIKSITKIEDNSRIINGAFSSDGPFTTRYAFTTNALPITKGANYGTVNLYGPEVHFALSNKFSLGLMSTWIASPLVLALKYSFKTKNEKINLSMGTLNGTSGYLNSFRGFGGLHFANITFGSRTKNLTISGGYAYILTGNEQFAIDPGVYLVIEPIGTSQPTPIIQGPVFSIACIAKVGAKASFVFDSMFGYFGQEGTLTTTTDATPADVFDNNWIWTVSSVTRTNLALFLMPGMRFQKMDKQAFQVSLAGVSVVRLSGYSSGSKKTESFPFPMFTWFYRF